MVGCQGCRACHDQQSEEYQSHGRENIGGCDDMPHCSDCHGDHGVLPSNVSNSPTHPLNLPYTCGKCHEDLDLVTEYDISVEHPTQIYESALNFTLYLGLAWLYRRKSFDGQVFAVYLIAYAFVRSFVELFRGDYSDGQYVAGWWTPAHWVSVLILVTGAVLWRQLSTNKSARTSS